MLAPARGPTAGVGLRVPERPRAWEENTALLGIVSPRRIRLLTDERSLSFLRGRREEHEQTEARPVLPAERLWPATNKSNPISVLYRGPWPLARLGRRNQGPPPPVLPPFDRSGKPGMDDAEGNRFFCLTVAGGRALRAMISTSTKSSDVDGQAWCTLECERGHPLPRANTCDFAGIHDLRSAGPCPRTGREGRPVSAIRREQFVAECLVL